MKTLSNTLGKIWDKDKYDNPMFSLEVMGDIRILYSVYRKTYDFYLENQLPFIRRFTSVNLFSLLTY